MSISFSIRVVKENGDREDKMHRIAIILLSLALVFSAVFSAVAQPHGGSVEHNFAGIGIKLKQSGTHFVIVSVLPDSPAAKSGLKEGDEVSSVQGQPLAGKGLREAVE